MALELNAEMMNVYPCQALPGSPLYIKAQQEGWDIPKEYEEFAFLSYECKPLPTKTLTSAEVLRFRDYFWETYFGDHLLESEIPTILKNMDLSCRLKPTCQVEQLRVLIF